MSMGVLRGVGGGGGGGGEGMGLLYAGAPMKPSIPVIGVCIIFALTKAKAPHACVLI